MSRRAAALAWLLVVLAALGYGGWRLHQGLTLQTDMMALLPADRNDAVAAAARGGVAEAFGRRLVFVVGHADRGTARDAAAKLRAGLEASGLVAGLSDSDGFRRLGEAYFPHRGRLLAERHRAALAAGRGDEVAEEALAQIYGLTGADSRLLRNDPFLLLPAFLLDLPKPQTRVGIDDGLATIVADGKTWILLSGRTAGNPYDMDYQERLVATADGLVATLAPAEVLRGGAAFYAHAGGTEAMDEASLIGILSTVGTTLLVLVVFRSLRPLWLTLLSIGTGLAVGFAACLALFGAPHVIALLFGASLIGIAEDYAVHYFSGSLEDDPQEPLARLRHALPGLGLGLATTLIGFLTLLLAPVPGMQQIAVFSAAGLSGAFLTLVLWVPLLDKPGRRKRLPGLLVPGERLWAFWRDGRRWPPLLAFLAMAAAAPLLLTVDDDVRRLQVLSPELKRQETAIEHLTGASTKLNFLVVEAADAEAALQLEERLTPRLAALVGEGALQSFRGLAQFAPSIARQQENRRLVDDLYGGHLAAHSARLGVGLEAPGRSDWLRPEQLPAEQLALLVPALAPVDGRAVHLVVLDRVARPQALRALAAEFEGVRYMAPAEDVSSLFGDYRRRALGLMAVSGVLMLLLLGWRYGLRGGLRCLLPPALAVAATPGVLAVMGQPFTFFHAMGLIMVLSIGVDFAVFCRESDEDGQPMTLLAVLLSGVTTILSFGLLGISSVFAVHAFGVTTLIGIVLSFLLAPLAALGEAPRLLKSVQVV